MSLFKEQLETDLDVFIDSDVFAETHTLNGVEVTCVLQGLTTKEQLTRPNNTPAFEGISGVTRVMHIKTSDMPEQVIEGNIIDVDGETYRVGDSVDDMGITTITLEVDRL